ncbi:hypothetical protein ACWCPD_38780 [Streptomyces sp. NPDC001935]
MPVNTGHDANLAIVTNLAAAELEQTVYTRLRGPHTEATLRMLARPLAGHPDHEGVGWAR